jgi:serine/threonine protein phosphatase PrpC
MRIRWKAFTVSKYGNRPDENEDAFWPVWRNKTLPELRRFRCAIADGATSTSFSSLWANLLVHCTAKRSISEFWKAIDASQKRWINGIQKIDLPWHAEEKVKEGSYATLVRFSIYQSRLYSRGFWKALCVGDSCLFQIRRSRLHSVIPLKRPAEFKNNPTLVSSLPKKNSLILDDHNRLYFSGRIFYDDRCIGKLVFGNVRKRSQCTFRKR